MVALARFIDGLNTDELVTENLLPSEDELDFLMPESRLLLQLLLLSGCLRVHAELIKVDSLLSILLQFDLTIRYSHAFRVDLSRLAGLFVFQHGNLFVILSD